MGGRRREVVFWERGGFDRGGRKTQENKGVFHPERVKN